jgi:hypothetical protein
MRKLLLSGMFTLLVTLVMFAQHTDRKPMPSADRARNTVERISKTVAFTNQQKNDVIAIFTKFFDDVRAQQAFRDPSKLEPLEKARDAKVEKLLNNPKLNKQYQDAVKEMKAQFQERQRQPRKP